MSKSMRNGWVILALAVLVAGCAKPGDKLMKEQVELKGKMAEQFEKVTDKASYEQIQPELKTLQGKFESNQNELAALTKEQQDAVIESNKTEMDSATKRWKDAMVMAHQKGLGLTRGKK